MQYESLQRQWDLIPKTAYSRSITIIGAGAVGSWAALALVKMGFLNVTVWDDDEVDIANLSNQFYPISSIGKKKVVALAEMVDMMTGCKINVVAERYTGKAMLNTDIVIAAVDSMDVRKLLFESCGPNVKHFIDPRMGAEMLMVYTYNPMLDAKVYADSWYSDSDAVAEKCTAKSTIYCANVISGIVCKIVKNIACGEKYPFNVKYSMKLNAFENWVAA